MSVVYYVMDGNDILISTMAERGKAKAVRRSPKVSLCVLDEKWPPTYLQVYCDAVVETDDNLVVDVMMRIGAVMAGEPIPEKARPLVAEGAKREKRVVLRLKPYATFETPPRHLEAAKDLDDPEKLKNLTHWASSTVPWDA